MTKTKTFVEHNRTVEIHSTDDDLIVIEIHDYSSGVERASVNLDYATHDFYDVVDLYKKDMLLIC